MKDFTVGMLKVTMFFCIPIFFLFVGACATEKDFERNCSTKKEYTPLFHAPIKCEITK